MTVLVDSSVWSLVVRRSSTRLSETQQVLRREVEDLAASGLVGMIGPIRQELLSGISRTEEYVRVRDQLRTFEDEPLVVEDYEQAAVVSNTSRTSGIAESHVDSLICAAALRRDWTVLTTDRDFRRYAEVVSVKVDLRAV